jgi:threonine dehydrogenase-like Zn-dependent dehydrogenase
VRALQTRNGRASLVDVSDLAADGEVLVRVSTSGICNTDLEIARGYAGFTGTLGHEFVGVVTDPGASGLTPNTRVVGEINAGCGSCVRCKANDPRHCPARTVLGIVGRDGAHADLLRLPARNLLAVPDAVDDVQATFVEPLAAAYGLLERCPIEPGMRVAVIGDGKLGILCALVLADAGFAPLLIGKHRDKLAIAARQGVETTLVDSARARGRVFGVVVEASGGASGFALALDLLLPQGRLVLKSTFHGATPVEAARIVVEEITVVGSRCGRFAPALDLLSRGAIDVRPLVSEVLELGQAEAAMDIAAKPGVLKVLLSRA